VERFLHLAHGERRIKIKRDIKSLLSDLFSALLRIAAPARENFARLYAHAALAADLDQRLPASAVVLGRVWIYGSRHIHIGEDVLLYPGVHLETQGEARIELGDNVVISRGAHLVAMAGVTVGRGTLIGEYTSVRDANHKRAPKQPIRDSGFSAKPILIGEDVWIGRGVTILGGVTIGDRATVGANAVVTRDVPQGVTVAGIPAAPISSRETPDRQSSERITVPHAIGAHR
jgi:acetyltransferase-like isoleucine patch superfamily enzyme